MPKTLPTSIGHGALVLGAMLLAAGAASAQPVAPNPFLSIGTETPAYDGWRMPDRHAEPAGSGAVARLVEEEQEPGDASGLNDSWQTAEFLHRLGTGAAEQPALDVRGTLYGPAATTIGPFDEDDGAIPLANQTGLTAGRRVRLDGAIGDGPFGSSGAASGDFDVFHVAVTEGGQRLVVDVDTPEGGTLNSKVALYDASGQIVAFNDDGHEASDDSFLDVRVAIPGDYYVFVRGAHSFWPTDPFDSATGPKAGSEGAYALTLGLDASDDDVFSFDLAAGDIVGLRIDGAPLRIELLGPEGGLLVGSSHDAGYLLPAASPLPVGGGATAFYVAPAAGRYAVRVTLGQGGYELALRLFRSVFEGPAGGLQRVFLDFDGAVVEAAATFGLGHEVAVLSPMYRFLEALGLDATAGSADAQAVIETAVVRFEEKVRADLATHGLNPDFYVEILNSRDHPDVFGAPGVSRIVVGGSTEELGIATIATAESVDVGNFVPEETAVVLVDPISTELGRGLAEQRYRLAPERTAAEFLGAALADIAAHEAGHLFGAFHTGTSPGPPNLMDQGRTFADFLGLGPDATYGTDDDVWVTFGEAPYFSREGFAGVQDTRNTLALVLTGTPPPTALGPAETPETTARLDPAFPNPFAAETHVTLHLARAEAVRVEVFDGLGRRVRVLHEGRLPAGPHHVFRLAAADLPAGLYLIRATGATFAAARTVLLVR